MTSVLAHRGASRAERENTTAAFARAVECGADGVELDVRCSVDGVLVVHHDPHYADGRAVSTTVGSERPAHVPDLDEALDACGPLWVNVEIKNDPAEAGFDPSDRIVDAVAHVLSRHGPPERWLVSSFRWETIERCRLVAPTLATGWLVTRPPDGAAALLARHGHHALHPYFALVDERLVQDCHRVGVAVNVWTCDDPEAMIRLAAWGVDGIVTNVPDLAVAALRTPRGPRPAG